MKLRTLLLLAFTALTKLAISQTSSVKGKVIDEKTAETLPGAVIQIEGSTTGVNTDLDGNFLLSNIQPGTYTILCKLISYNTKVIKEVKVESGESTFLTISMQSASTDLGVVEVVSKMSTESNNSLLILQKNSPTLSDGVSAEGIKRTPDKTTSDVLKRVSGASVQDNKFVIVRGLNDRYNSAYLNGAPLPSSEPDRKAFSFDIFPSNMLDNLLVIKSATPDQTGEFAGGIIQINTRNIPEQNFNSLSVGMGYNTITTGKEQLTYNGGKTDWLGIDDGTRSLDPNIPEQADFPLNINQQAALAKNTNSDWATQSKKFSPNYNLQFSTGYNDSIFKRPMGVILALTYNKSSSFNETINRTYSGNGASNNTPSQIESDYLTRNHSEQILTGALGNFAVQLNANNTISFKNLFSINSDDRVITKTGEINPLDANPSLLKANALWFTSNRIYSGQLGGEHELYKQKLRISWVGGLSSVRRSVPNLRRNIYTRYEHFNDPNDPYLPDTAYAASIAQTNVGPDYGGGMFFSENRENIYSINADAAYELNAFNKLKTKIKIGGMLQLRDREFFARQLGYTKYGISGGSVSFRDSLLYLPANEIFSESNMGLIYTGAGGFKLSDGTKPSDKYTASSSLRAGYLMFDNSFGIARLIWGMRIENFNQKLFALKAVGDTVDLDQSKTDLLPSANLILALTEKQNLRMSYYMTVNRPEYRELAPFAFYDFTTGFVTTGNDSLQRAVINNLDLRYEFYPGKGQLASVSFFYKQFNDPIEMSADPSFDHQVTYRNVSGATNYGVELEFRTMIGSLIGIDSAATINNFTLFSNLAIIRSDVDVSEVRGATAGNRPLQGTSPYVLNAGLQYLDKDNCFSVTASLNKVGPRISIVGSSLEPEIWENSRTFLDLQLAKSFLKNKMELKINAQNLLAQDQIFYQNRDLEDQKVSGINGFFNSVFAGSTENKNGYDNSEDDLYSSMKTGRIFSFSISYKF
jgi:hypothetical protein